MIRGYALAVAFHVALRWLLSPSVPSRSAPITLLLWLDVSAVLVLLGSVIRVGAALTSIVLVVAADGPMVGSLAVLLVVEGTPLAGVVAILPGWLLTRLFPAFSLPLYVLRLVGTRRALPASRLVSLHVS